MTLGMMLRFSIIAMFPSLNRHCTLFGPWAIGCQCLSLLLLLLLCGMAAFFKVMLTVQGDMGQLLKAPLALQGTDSAYVHLIFCLKPLLCGVFAQVAEVEAQYAELSSQLAEAKEQLDTFNAQTNERVEELTAAQEQVSTGFGGSGIRGIWSDLDGLTCAPDFALPMFEGCTCRQGVHAGQGRPILDNGIAACICGDMARVKHSKHLPDGVHSR